MNSNDSQRRLLLALGLSFLLTTLYVTFFAPKPEPTADAHGADAGRLTPAQVAATVGVDAGSLAVAPTLAAPAEVPAAAEDAPEQTLRKTRELVHYTFNSRGAGLTQAELQGAKMREQRQFSLAEGFGALVGRPVSPSPQMDLAVPVPGVPLPLSLSIDGAQPLPADTAYEVVDSGEDRAVFTARRGPWEVKKTLSWAKAGFEMGYEVQVTNVSGAKAEGELALHYARAIAPDHEQAPNFFGGIGNQSRATCAVGDEVHHQLPEKETKTQDFRGPVRFVGVDHPYFLAAVYPLDGPREGRCVLNATTAARSADALFPLALGPGESTTYRFGAYVGPKDSEVLSLVPAAGIVGGAAATTPTYRPELERTVDFGVFAVICKLLLVVMKFFFQLTHNWGVAIVLLTVSVKLVLLPLTHKSMVAAEDMKKLQPKMAEIRTKFENDRERQNLEMMKLYQEAKVNPLGGCLPLVLQMPVWFALFTTLRTSYELYREPFISPVWADLTYKDPTYLLPLALGATMIVTQKLQPQMMDAAQAKIMTYVMPVFFTAIMLNYPAGLSLYIFTNNVLSIVQQFALRKYLTRKGVLTASSENLKERKA